VPGGGVGDGVGFVELSLPPGPLARLVPTTGGLVGLRESSQFAVASAASTRARRTRQRISLT
jgi:hypothetical protein